MRRRVFDLPIRWALPLALLLLLSSPAFATIVLRASIEELATTAHLVVRANVVSSESAWSPGRETIRTIVKLEVEEVLKGSTGKSVTLTLPGGRVGEDQVRVSGVPAFEARADVVVFLWKNRHGDFLVLGLNQGKFELRLDPDTGTRLARNSLDGLAFHTRAGDEKRPVRDELPLSELRERIREQVEKDARRPAEEEASDPVEEETVERTFEVELRMGADGTEVRVSGAWHALQPGLLEIERVLSSEVFTRGHIRSGPGVPKEDLRKVEEVLLRAEHMKKVEEVQLPEGESEK